MKRQLLIVLVGALAMILAACGGQTPQAPASPAPADTVAPAAPADTAAPTATEAPPATTAPPAGGETQQPTPGGRIQTILTRGELICGVNQVLPGFGNVDSAGEFSGFDVDFCRATAAALFDDPTAVQFRPLTAQERFTAVQTGEVDVLIRNTTWTLTRDGSVGLDFGPVTFYDGQGMMVRIDSGIETLEDMEGATICVQSGTTTELNLADNFRAIGVNFTPQVFEDADQTAAAYDAGQCDGFTTDKSGLVSYQTKLAVPADHKILDVTMSKEPLGPSVLQGDAQWADAINWVVLATIQAEEFGITSENIGDFLTSDNPDIRRFLGVEGELGQGIGLPNDFAARIISSVGNYEEIYNRNLGPETPFNLPRGQNALYTDGGLLYSPPFR
ncbi:amino acid ABC transporter substrate-binding protein [Candidatus Chloroploca sp. M-50]|uniref:Amino acid ABC transporter substrate-binding protein n=1 Tax=Candidatus Chloroploca mongolica TaxID=2528176 RepID=A0ABS4D4N2_9CHLR|nr:amino acid ABC transporter substrate-binding protein [Candidatus Chloroploca mongolica]MBP1464402.1 amino acid ABC transporter substrate-binding protein [Candidatus Chloroploca mongolica]